MKTRLWAVLVLMLLGFGAQAQVLSGKEIFNGNCTACHSLGGGDLVGPDLAGVTERREADWIKRFITNSQQMVAEGDKIAVELFKKYNSIPMPSHKFSDEELNKLVSYLDEAGKEALAAKTTPEETPEAAQKEEVKVVEASSPVMPMSVKVILGLLGTAAIILSFTAIYLVRMLRS